MKVLGLYVGKKRPFGPRGQFSGIRKDAVESVTVDANGIVDDVQVDKRFHGGVERALHQFAVSSYEKISKQYPLMHKKAVLGGVGENLVADGMDDRSVCIGDTYQIGGVKVQVSSPRIPCWKMADVMEMPQLDKFVAKKGISGWYYRILEEGQITLGDDIQLLERVNPDLSINQFMRINYDKQASAEEIDMAANAEGLDPEWQERLKLRLEVKKSAETESADYEV